MHLGFLALLMLSQYQAAIGGSVAGQKRDDLPGIQVWRSLRTRRAMISGTKGNHSGLLPQNVDLRANFSEFGLSVCSQDGPWCWDYTALSVVEYEAAAELGQRCSLSPGYLAWAAQKTDSQGTGGSNFGRANRGFENFGAVPSSVLGIPPPSGSVPTPADSVVKIGAAFGDIDFHWIRFWNRTDISTDQMREIKSCLAHGHPVAVGMQWPDSTEFVPGSTVMRVPDRKRVFDGHCVVLVGYEDDASLPGGGAFLFRNSWGRDWADGGYAKMPYALLAFCINDAFCVDRVIPRRELSADSVTIFDAKDLPTKVAQGTVTSQDMSSFGSAWNGKAQSLFTAEKTGAEFGVRLDPVERGQYEVRLVITRAENCGQFRVRLPDGSVSQVIDGAGPGVSKSKPISIGNCDFRAHSQQITFRVVGKSSASSGLNIGLFQILLIRKVSSQANHPGSNRRLSFNPGDLGQ